MYILYTYPDFWLKGNKRELPGLSVHIHFHGSGALGYVGRAFDPLGWPLPARDCRLHRCAVRRFGGRTLEVEPKGTPAATS